MQTTLRIDKESFGFTSISEHQQIALSNIFEKIKDSGIDIYFKCTKNNEDYFYDSYLNILKSDSILELPWIKKKNRKFILDNIIVVENFLNPGENIIYILNEILNSIEKVTFKSLLKNLSYFDTERQEE
jgi:hypothetical protein